MYINLNCLSLYLLGVAFTDLPVSIIMLQHDIHNIPNNTGLFFSYHNLILQQFGRHKNTS